MTHIHSAKKKVDLNDNRHVFHYAGWCFVATHHGPFFRVFQIAYDPVNLKPLRNAD